MDPLSHRGPGVRNYNLCGIAYNEPAASVARKRASRRSFTCIWEGTMKCFPNHARADKSGDGWLAVTAFYSSIGQSARSKWSTRRYAAVRFDERTRKRFICTHNPRSIFLRSPRSLGMAKVLAMPLFEARPVRPMRWMKSSASLGMS
jgi:hypothetical protein